jgi:phosphoribosylformylglycinamidine (FGAM) synthase-like enzyme
MIVDQAFACLFLFCRGDRADLDFNAVQRGDAEMSQKLWRVVRSCVEMGDKNPIVQIHDQGGECVSANGLHCVLM